MNLEVTTSQVIPIFKFKKKSLKLTLGRIVHANSYPHRDTRGVGVDRTRP